MALCLYHRVSHVDGDECPACVANGMRVVVCELDKIERVQSSMEQAGWRWQADSYAVLIFRPAPDEPVSEALIGCVLAGPHVHPRGVSCGATAA